MKIVRIVGIVIAVALTILFGAETFTTVAADEIVVKQGFFTGALTVWTDPGPKFQNFGTLTRYKKSSQYSFSAVKDQGKEKDESIKARFNDGGHGNISGTLQVDLPLDAKNMSELHMKFHSQDAIEQRLVRTAVERAIYMSGPLMSSKESAAERRSDLLKFIEDQVRFGVYQTLTKSEKVQDEVSGKEKTVARVELIPDGKGGFARQEASSLQQYGIRTYSYNINGIKYEDLVEAQIAEQQKLAMKIQTAMAQSKEAEQRAITAAKEGEASAAKAKADQEVLKATEVTKAEQEKAVALTNAQREKEVAQLALETAELKKKEQILLGEGEASRARAMMQATGFLPERLEAWTKVALVYAEQSGKQRQTPDVVMGGGGNKPDLSDIMQMSLARQLGLGSLGK
jgi:hypothetical protein